MKTSTISFERLAPRVWGRQYLRNNKYYLFDDCNEKKMIDFFFFYLIQPIVHEKTEQTKKESNW